MDQSVLMKPFLDAANGANEASVRAIVTKVLGRADLFAGYHELLQDLTNPPDEIRQTLSLFSYRSWDDYVQNQSQFVQLNDSQTYKLKQLTVLSLLPHHPVSLPYSVVQKALALDDVEPILISLLYAGTISGQLCQKSRALYWTACRVSRDVPHVTALLNQVRQWRLVTAQAQEALAQQDKYMEHVHEQDEQYWKQFDNTISQQTGSRLEVGVYATATSRRQKRTRGGLANTGMSHFQV